jgi:hypothetical protein
MSADWVSGPVIKTGLGIAVPEDALVNALKRVAVLEREIELYKGDLKRAQAKLDAAMLTLDEHGLEPWKP